MKTLIPAAALLTATLTCAPALAQEATGPWSLRLGLAHIGFDESAQIGLGGTTVPGASFETDNDTTLTVSLGYRFNERFSVEGTVGLPPTAALTGTGPLAGVPLGEVTYGPATLTGLYHMPFANGLEAYVGGGVNYTIVFDTEDGTVSDFEVDNAWAPVLQVGLSGAIPDTRAAWFLDAKYIALETKARGTVGGAPATADITLNPTILTAGIAISF
ncbi:MULTISPECIES: OmpW/AlkL family protein [Roseobacteraceae]|jgi:outer membrane protein|uniref:Outer membrane protein n=1 Tax=Phaeobacter inhibens TaxID=221822 RepID=A0A2I7KGG6_9RHOB|nr:MULTISPECIES: OmpW family outer membrane protein [Roseobacteraceae]AUR01683.1 outer membrane protein [Phaeobacter inhibens]